MANRPIPFQFGPSRLDIKRSSIDWITNVLEPIGWSKHYVVNIPAPTFPSEKEYLEVFTELDKASNSYLSGDDTSVFYHAYNAFDPIFYSKRSDILPKVAKGDESKQSALENLIKAVHRFANGARHLPEDGKIGGAFAVDHIDAEYVRGLVGLSIAYLAKRLHSYSIHSQEYRLISHTEVDPEIRTGG